MISSAGGKGSARRPSQVPQKVVDENWERIYGKKKEEPHECQCRSNEGSCSKGGQCCQSKQNQGN